MLYPHISASNNQNRSNPDYTYKFQSSCRTFPHCNLQDTSCTRTSSTDRSRILSSRNILPSHRILDSDNFQDTSEFEFHNPNPQRRGHNGTLHYCTFLDLSMDYLLRDTSSQ